MTHTILHTLTKYVHGCFRVEEEAVEQEGEQINDDKGAHEQKEEVTVKQEGPKEEEQIYKRRNDDEEENTKK
jgi:hypothetical protein